MKSFGEYLLLYEVDVRLTRPQDDPRRVKKYTEKPGLGLSARKPTMTTGKASTTKHTGPTAATPASSPGEERVLSKLRTSRFAAASSALKNRAALKKRAAILSKGRKR